MDGSGNLDKTTYLVKKPLGVVGPCNTREFDIADLFVKSSGIMVCQLPRCEGLSGAADIDREDIATLNRMCEPYCVEIGKICSPTWKCRMRSIRLSEKWQKWSLQQCHLRITN